MKRVLSLDILRGLTICGMILVNCPGPGGTLSMLRHKTWDGCVVADLVFPFFIFIVGASIFFAMKKSDYRLDWGVAARIVKRSILIFAVGYVLNALWFTTPIENIRIMAALQRIAIVYLLAAFAVLWLRTPARIAGLTAVLLLGYWALVHFTGSYALTDTNAIAGMDASILGAGRMYHIAGVMFDPEGIVGTMPALCNAFIGYLVAGLISKRGSRPVCFWGVVMVAVGLGWSVWFPVNKPLWSSSFVLWTCGLATMLWALFYYMVDVRGWSRWGGFFKVFGVNAITCYVASQLLSTLNWTFDFSLSGWLFDNVYGDVFAGWLSSLVWSLLILGLTWGLAWILDRKKIYIKL